MARILICDDEKDIVSALKIYLEAEGYETVCTYTGQQALEALEREEVQLVLLDIMMPGLDGIGALARIRETSNVPVIFLTAKGEDIVRLCEAIRHDVKERFGVEIRPEVNVV